MVNPTPINASANLFVIAWETHASKAPLAAIRQNYLLGEANDFPQPIQFQDTASSNLFVIAWDTHTARFPMVRIRNFYLMSQNAVPIPIIPPPIANVVLLDNAYGSSNVIREYPLARFGPLPLNQTVIVIMELWMPPSMSGQDTVTLPATWRITRPDGSFYSAQATVGLGEFLLAPGTYTYYPFATNELSQQGTWEVRCFVGPFAAPVTSFTVL